MCCNAGFYTLHHTDIDECEKQMDDCSVNANCSDNEGSFNCTCVTGYEGNGVNCTSKCKSYVAGILPNNNALIMNPCAGWYIVKFCCSTSPRCLLCVSPRCNADFNTSLH